MKSIAILGALCLFAGGAVGGEEKPVVLLDFESIEPADGWTVRNLDLSEPAVEEGKTPSGGRALGIGGTSRGGHLYRPISVSDWRPFRALSFFAKVEAKRPIEMRVAAVEAASFRSLLHRFTLSPGDWREVVLPLSEFRPDPRRAHGRFDRVGRLLIQWDEDGGEGRVEIDDLRLLPGDRGPASCLPTLEDRLALAFPDGGGRAIEGESFVVLTDVRELRGRTAKSLLAHLEAGLALLRDRWRVPGELPDRAPLVVFRTREEYRDFAVRLGKSIGDCIWRGS